MNALLLEQCRAYLRAHAALDAAAGPKSPTCRRAVTISRETGAGAIATGRLLAEYLESRQTSEDRSSWVLFDRELVKEILKDQKLPESLEQYFPEDASPRMNDFVEDMLGLHPSARTMVQHTTRTMLRLAAAGNVILIGRGSHLVTAHLKHVFHVRLIAPLEHRIRHIEEFHNLSHRAAAEYVRKGDLARTGYLRRHFKSPARDALQYHVTVNTGRMSYLDAARMIGEAVLNLPAEHAG